MTQHEGAAAPAGSLRLHVVRGEESPWPQRQLSVAEIGHYGLPRRGLPDEVNAWRKANRPNLARGLRKILPARALRLPHFYGQLFLSHLTAEGDRVDYGLAGMRVVTTAGVRYICDDMNNNTGSADVTLFKFHGIGTGAGAEAVGNTALTTEITTAYATDNTRPTGTQASATVSNDATYTTVGTITVDATVAATEHGIFTQAATGGGTLLDKTLFTVVNLASGDSLQATYVFTMVAGS
jgi:hypothetical protein